MPDDNLTAVLDQIKFRDERVWQFRGKPEALMLIEAAKDDVPRLLRAVEAVLAAHAPQMIYDSGDDCGHKVPEMDDEAAYDEWQANHPFGSDLADEGIRICLLSPREEACRACSELVYETWGDDDRWVSASECIVRPAISRALLPEDAQ